MAEGNTISPGKSSSRAVPSLLNLEEYRQHKEKERSMEIESFKELSELLLPGHTGEPTESDILNATLIHIEQLKQIEKAQEEEFRVLRELYVSNLSRLENLKRECGMKVYTDDTGEDKAIKSVLSKPDTPHTEITDIETAVNYRTQTDQSASN